MFTIREKYIETVALMFLIGILIFLTDGFGIQWVRFYMGDFVAVVLLYFLVSCVFSVEIKKKIAAVLFFALFLEVAQMFHTQHAMQSSWFIELFVGSTFDVIDLVAYLVAAIFAGCLDFYLQKNPSNNNQNTET